MPLCALSAFRFHASEEICEYSLPASRHGKHHGRPSHPDGGAKMVHGANMKKYTQRKYITKSNKNNKKIKQNIINYIKRRHTDTAELLGEGKNKSPQNTL